MSTTPATTPPKTARWAIGLWWTGGVLLVLFGVIVAAVNDHAGVRTIGIIYVLIGIADIVLGRRAFGRDSRARSAVSVLTLVVTMLSMIGAVILGTAVAMLLLASLFALGGSLMSYRPTSEPWFNPKS
ncbi:hypothetical protein GCM10027169_07510 [Gordonia jinhuaensis]|uniref:Uncharacterized protein n=1 Tax=Gordonia jinhuaensis TaxID=1517702 RepID=A0A916SXM4_9ACTN|nr:hypothetical protein [Gordonia jinhuaensis]GGB21528.1 hypothetical protein GCM10011489_07110 [Gordonia jinhuaensis]